MQGCPPMAHGLHVAQDGYECSPTCKFTFFFFAHQFFLVFVYLTYLLPVCPRDAKWLDTPEPFREDCTHGCRSRKPLCMKPEDPLAAGVNRDGHWSIPFLSPPGLKHTFPRLWRLWWLTVPPPSAEEGLFTQVHTLISGATCMLHLVDAVVKALVPCSNSGQLFRATSAPEVPVGLT